MSVGFLHHSEVVTTWKAIWLGAEIDKAENDHFQGVRFGGGTESGMAIGEVSRRDCNFFLTVSDAETIIDYFKRTTFASSYSTVLTRRENACTVSQV